MKYFSSILAFLVLSLGGGVIITHAQGYTPLAPLPGTTDTGTGTTDLPTYIAGAIKLLIALGAALAVLYAIIGGTQYVAAGISPDAKSGAKERIVNALIGLGIILSSYLILNSINPDLVNFKLTLSPVTVRNLAPSLTAGVGGNGNNPATPNNPCSVQAPDMSLVDPSVDPEAASMEAGNKIIWTSSDPTIQANLTKLHAQVTKLQLGLYQPPIFGSVVVTSAYRPYNYQKHLYQIYKAWVVDDLQNNTDPACADEKAMVGAEYAKHGLGSLVANPDSQYSPHMNGTGVDLSPVNVNYSDFTMYGSFHWMDVNSYMTNNGIMMNWQGIPGDPWHFNLR